MAIGCATGIIALSLSAGQDLRTVKDVREKSLSHRKSLTVLLVKKLL